MLLLIYYLKKKTSFLNYFNNDFCNFVVFWKTTLRTLRRFKLSTKVLKEYHMTG